VQATEIALECIKLPIPNTPMLGALVKVLGNLPLESVIGDVRKKLEQKFRHKPQVIEGNLESIRRAYHEVKGEE
jgi:pyruvate ferredoxin oxidoreductase gamma subunit